MTRRAPYDGPVAGRRDRLTAGVRRELRAPIAPSTGALLLFWASLTPSLLPRSAFFQGLVAGAAALIGYALGWLSGWVVRRCGGRLTGTTRRRAWWVLGVAALVGTVVMVTAYVRWERALRAQVAKDFSGAVSIRVRFASRLPKWPAACHEVPQRTD